LISSISEKLQGKTISFEGQNRPSLAWRNDHELVQSSERGGHPNLSLLDVDTQTRSSLTSGPFVDRDAVAVPGSEAVVFSSNRTGEFHLFEFDPNLQASQLRQLTSGSGYEELPSVSPDRSFIVYTSWAANAPAIFRLSLQDPRPRRLLSVPARDPQISPNGKWVACQLETNARGRWATGVVPVDGKTPVRVLPSIEWPGRWSSDGSALLTVRRDEHKIANVWALSLNGSGSQRLTDFNDDQDILTFAVGPNGRLACIRSGIGSDVVAFSRHTPE
jgi:Tol biopolymer transport system component